MTINFGHGRNNLDQSDWVITTSSGGNLSPSVKSFSLQAGNQIGYNQLIVSSEVTIVENNKITIQFNSSGKKSGECWHYFIVGISDNDNPESFNQILKIPLFEHDVDGNIDLESPITFPIVVELTEDEHLYAQEFVTDAIDLPTQNLLNGMRRGLSVSNSVYELNLYAVGEPDGNYAISAPVGLWLKKEGFSNYVANVALPGGCAYDLVGITSFTSIEVPNYAGDGSASKKVQYYVVNNNGFDLS